MRKIVVAACAAAAVVVVMPASASAADTCQARATWKTAWWVDDVTITVDRATATGAGCARLLPADGTRYTLFGAHTVGLPWFAVWNVKRDVESGWMKVSGGDLDAVLHGTGDSRTVTVFDGDGSTCGDWCFRTKGYWTGG
ncbi:MAG TPA: hypothetical protein VGW10_14400 [Solirubrobacteraceae bacterium]|nr:hypothetical protein [Solirubrobacteraceae bacterium]